MEISLLQAFALGIIAFIAGLDMFNGLTHMHRPVVLGPLVGLVLGDLHTPVSIYLKVRDMYPQSVLMESSDFHAGENSMSYIALCPLARRLPLLLA